MGLGAVILSPEPQLNAIPLVLWWAPECNGGFPLCKSCFSPCLGNWQHSNTDQLPAALSAPAVLTIWLCRVCRRFLDPAPVLCKPRLKSSNPLCLCLAVGLPSASDGSMFASVLRPLPVLLRPRRGVVTLNVKEGENVPVRCSALLALLTYCTVIAALWP